MWFTVLGVHPVGGELDESRQLRALLRGYLRIDQLLHAVRGKTPGVTLSGKDIAIAGQEPGLEVRTPIDRMVLTQVAISRVGDAHRFAMGKVEQRLNIHDYCSPYSAAVNWRM
ncbi:hypothetical protein D3C80_1651440 [compost metagenome]